MPRTLILGGGVSGLSTALSLLDAGHRVTVLDRARAASESTWAGGGILCPLLPWDYGAAVSVLALAAIRMWPDWAQTIRTTSGIDPEYLPCGMRVLGMGDPEAAWAWCNRHALAVERSKDTLILPWVAQVRNPRLGQALRAACIARGARIIESAAPPGLRHDAGRVVGVVSGNACIEADFVVVATGAWAGSPGLGFAPVPHVRPIKGQMLLYVLPPGTLSTILYADGLYLIPRRDGHILVGSTLEDCGFDKSTDPHTAARLHAAAAKLFPPLRDARPIRHWAGLRPGSPDNIPVIDRHPDFDNLFVNVGHYRYGLTMAPAAAALAAALITGRPLPLDPTPYRWQAHAARTWVTLRETRHAG